MKNLIGISSHIGGGKDTVGRIIQFLTQDHMELSVEDMLNYPLTNPPPTTPWEIKKFAGKLKECVSVITGIPVVDLESEQVKSSNLGPEWNRWELIEPDTKRIMPMTVRQLLQNFGTECGRSVHTNFWVNALFSDFDPKTPVVIPNDDFITKPKKYKNTVVPCKIPHWIITDCRFPNELESIESRDGVVLRINRNDNRRMENRHSSETALDCHQFKYVIDNNGTISELVEKVEGVLRNIKIL